MSGRPDVSAHEALLDAADRLAEKGSVDPVEAQRWLRDRPVYEDGADTFADSWENDSGHGAHWGRF